MNTRLSFLVILLLLLSLPAQAGVTALTCTIAAPTDSNKRYNGGQMVNLKAAWTGDTPPFAATFKAKGTPVGTVNTSTSNADFAISAASLAEGDNQFTVSVIETSVANAPSSPDAPATGKVTVDKIAPTMTITVLSGGVVSPNTGTNEVVIQVTANESLGEAPTFTISPGTWGAPAPVTPEAAPFSSNQYKINVPTGTAGGMYTIRVSGRDETDPAVSRNTGTAQTSFTVDAAADGAPAINTSAPPSPTRAESVVLTGSISAESGEQKVEVLDGTTVLGRTTVAANATAWTYTATSLTEGSHSFTARRIDPLGNISAAGAPLTVICDRTAPATPVLSAPKSPVNTVKVSITGTAVTDPPHSSGPLKVKLMRSSEPVGSTTADASGRFTFTDVELKPGSNMLFAQAADTTWDNAGSAGNSSGFSTPITILLDQAAPVVVSPGGVVISSNVTPSTRLSGGLLLSQEGGTNHPETSGPEGGTQAADQPGTVRPAEPNVPSPITNHLIAGRVDVSGTPPVSAETRFLPPPGDRPTGPTALRLPFATVQDRDSRHLQVWVIVRQTTTVAATGGNPADPPTIRKIPLVPQGTAWAGWLPTDRQSLSYRFQLRDRAGNTSWFPTNGEFRHPAVRCAILRLPAQPDAGTVGEADEWPLDILGLPPVSRLKAYRRLEVHSRHLPAVQNLLQKAGADRGILIVPFGTKPAPVPGWSIDLDLLRRGQLPRERVDLLLEEVRSGAIPLRNLPSPERLRTSAGAGAIADAIRFRLLHERGR